MSATKAGATSKAKTPDRIASLLRYNGSCPMELTGSDNGLYERHLAFDNVVKLGAANWRWRIALNTQCSVAFEWLSDLTKTR
jgi:hypothetical protein